jgi:hypothetical protein
MPSKCIKKILTFFTDIHETSLDPKERFSQIEQKVGTKFGGSLETPS